MFTVSLRFTALSFAALNLMLGLSIEAVDVSAAKLKRMHDPPRTAPTISAAAYATMDPMTAHQLHGINAVNEEVQVSTFEAVGLHVRRRLQAFSDGVFLNDVVVIVGGVTAVLILASIAAFNKWCKPKNDGLTNFTYV